MDLYRRESNKIIGAFTEALPTGEVGEMCTNLVCCSQLTLKQEKASIDEAFIDFTRPIREKLLERYPYLAQVPADAPDGIDSPLPPPPPIHWDGLGSVVPVSPSEETDGASELSDEVDDGTTWHDVALFIAAEMMRKIRKDVHLKLGYTTSAVSEFRPC